MTTKTVIAGALEDLSQDDLAKFRLWLRERKSDGPRVRRAQVDGKNPLQLADLLVETFCENRAVQVTVELLRAIGCTRVAEELAEEANKLLQPAQTRQNPPAPAPGASAAPARDEHFVDRHRIQLTERVSNINPVLDLLLQERVLTPEQYTEIRSIRTRQEQMRFLYQGPLTSGGERSKDVFLSALRAHEIYLIKDLEEREG
ncbi:hypothetical protein NL108_011727 [Boleophthalmus pectinirostris]|uniref:apoptosis-associated speck-like protein containing a CARD n=1 Tax=Boleophthalmus pectinirostris TaxID=150288 RepID=UPI000A1C54E3|nr:apoptosis-associated speck-like protein containing a CARD [Boleophthalmus pectinirostris]KAJ0066376.1 hypothetical protein NL108_011727 [Boleophthalmus pectinirostris]